MTTATKSTSKEDARAILEKLPEDVTWKEIAARFRLQQAVEQSLEDSRQGRIIPHEEVMAEIEQFEAGIKKEQLLRLIKSLPQETSWGDLLYRLSVLRAVEVGMRDCDEGRVVGHEEMKREFGFHE